MKTDALNNRHLIAEEGKVLRLISDGWIAGTEIFLGYTYYIGGELLAEPLFELPEHYEEIDELDTVADEDFDTVVPESAVMLLSETEPDEVPVPEEPKRVTLADLLSKALVEIDGLKKEISELKKSN